MDFDLNEQNINRKLTLDEYKVYLAFKELLEKFKENKPIEIEGHFITKNSIGVFFSPLNAKKDIKFSIPIEDLNSRFVFLTRELKGLGNGSYYVFDTLTEKVVYKEDD